MEWKDRCAKTKNSGYPNAAFDAIVAMGKVRAVPPVMVEYARDVGG